jgi:heme-degrading monooxygenase HmoA
LLNKFTVKHEDVDQFLKVFAITTEMFKHQPGFISAQLHGGISGSSMFINYVVWESAEHFKQAFNRPEFRSSMVDAISDITGVKFDRVCHTGLSTWWAYLINKKIVSGECRHQTTRVE